jgi:hypothetical protein
MKSTIGFIIFVLIIVLVLYVISGKRYPQVPGDDFHKAVEVSNSTVCMECHGQSKKAALKETHPPKFECFRCHKPARKGGGA